MLVPDPRRSSPRRALLGAMALAVGAGLSVASGAQAAPADDPIKITQNYSEEIRHSVICASGPIQHLRRFHLDTDHASSSGFTVTSAAYGVLAYQASESPEALTGSMSAYSIEPAAELTRANLNLITTQEITFREVGDADIVSVPLPAEVPAGMDLVLALRIGEEANSHIASGHSTDPELRDSYVDECGFAEPTPLDSVGLPNSNPIIQAFGTSHDCTTARSEADTTSAALDQARETRRQARADRVTAAKAMRAARKANIEARTKYGRDSQQAAKARATMRKAKSTKTKARAAAVEANAAVVPVAEDFRTSRRTARDECAQPQLPTLPPGASTTQGDRGMQSGPSRIVPTK